MSDWDLQDVVVGIDGSDESSRALDAAIGIARRHGAALHVLTIAQPPDRWWGVMGTPPPGDEVVDAMQLAQRKLLEDSIKERDVAGLEVTLRDEMGSPAYELTDYCEKVSAGLLVVGRRGAGMVERLLLGSVADRLAHHAPCPLLIVP